MGIKTNMFVQMVAILAQIVNHGSGIIPEEYRTVVLAAIALVQALVAMIAHKSNPDGKSATLAFNPTTKKSVTA